MELPDLTNKLENLVTNIERIYLENISLKSMFMNLRRQSGQLVLPEWEKELQELMASDEAQKIAAEKFVPLRQALTEAVDEYAAFAALLQLSPKGTIN
jgi:hypothetical protein